MVKSMVGLLLIVASMIAISFLFVWIMERLS